MARLKQEPGVECVVLDYLIEPMFVPKYPYYFTAYQTSKFGNVAQWPPHFSGAERGGDSVNEPKQKRSVLTSGTALVFYVAIFRLALYLYAAPNYGYSRDELYYLACGEHPAWGYVDQPPLVGWMAWMLEHTVGTGLYALRFLPMLAGVATVLLTGMVAQELGGKRWAMFIAATAAMLGPVFLAVTHVFSMNAFDFPLWTLLVFILLRIQKFGNEKLWLLFGAVLGVTVLNKYGIAFFVTGMFLGVAIGPMRRNLTRRWFWLGLCLAAAIALPNFLWQLNRDFPFLQLMRNVRASGRDIALPPISFLVDQMTLIGFISALLVPLGLAFVLTNKGRPFLVPAIGFLTLLVTMMVLHGKGTYVTPAYPVMFAAGATALEQWTTKKSLFWITPVFAFLLTTLGVATIPLGFPILSPEKFIAYTAKLGMEQPHYENQPKGRLPQFYADMFGWEERVRLVADYYNHLSPEERRKTVVLATNYGDAGAVDLFGPKYGLPKAISTHQNYWNWGPRQYTGESLIILGGGNQARDCASLTTVAVPNNPYARPDANLPILHCRGLRKNLQDLWPSIRQLG
jgi:hypothetical protein